MSLSPLIGPTIVPRIVTSESRAPNHRLRMPTGETGRVFWSSLDRIGGANHDTRSQTFQQGGVRLLWATRPRANAAC